MTIAASSLMQVAPRELYRDVAHTRWPVAIEPHADELLSSWLHRLANANGISPEILQGSFGFARACGPPGST